MKRNWLLALLVSVNVALAAAIVLYTAPPKPAFAQAAGLSGNYLAVSGEMQDQWDALYLLDLRTRHLHAFYYDKSRKELMYSDVRSLERDFRNNKD